MRKRKGSIRYRFYDTQKILRRHAPQDDTEDGTDLGCLRRTVGDAGPYKKGFLFRPCHCEQAQPAWQSPAFYIIIMWREYLPGVRA